MKKCPEVARAALALTLFAGCGYSTPEPREPVTTGQTYAEALRVMCDVDELAGGVPDDPFEASRKRSETISSLVENPDAIYLRTMLSVKGAADQGKELRREAGEAGIAECALASALEKSGDGGIAP